MDNNSDGAASVVRRWLPALAVALLIAQVALLWLQGALLNRQRAELVSLRSEVRELTAAVNDALFVEDEPFSTPAAMRPAGVCPHCGRGRNTAARPPGDK